MDFAKKTSRIKRTRKLKFNFVWVFIVVGMIATGGAGFFIYKSFTDANGYLARNINAAKSWLTERSTSLQKGVVKVKHLAVTKEEEQQIHFEFYTALPNAKLATAEVDNTAEEEVIIKKPIKKVIAASAIFASPEELEKELSEKIKQTHSSSR